MHSYRSGGSSNEVESWENNDCYILCGCQYCLLSPPTPECFSCPASHKSSRQIQKSCFPTCFGWWNKVITAVMQHWIEGEEKNTVCKVRAKRTWYFVWAASHSASTSAGNRLIKRAKLESKPPTHWNTSRLPNTPLVLMEDIQLLPQNPLVTMTRKMLLLKNLTHGWRAIHYKGMVNCSEYRWYSAPFLFQTKWWSEKHTKQVTDSINKMDVPSK